MSRLNTSLIEALKSQNQELVLPEGPGPGLTDILLNVAGTAGTILDTPGAALRGVIGGQNPAEVLSAVFNPRERITGNQLLGRPKDQFSWGGLGVEVLLDPLNLVGVGAATKAGQAANRLSKLKPALKVAEAVGNNQQAVDMIKLIKELEPIAASGPKRSLLSLDIPFGPKASIIESQAANTFLDNTIGRVGRAAATPFKPAAKFIKSKFSTSLGDDTVDAFVSHFRGENRLSSLEARRAGLSVVKEIDELVQRTGLKQEEVFDLFSLARETEEGIAKLEKEIFELGEKHLAGDVVKMNTIEDVLKTAKIVEKNPAIAIDRSLPFEEFEEAERKLRGRVKYIEKKITQHSEFTKRLENVPEPVRIFAKQYGQPIDKSFLEAAAQGVQFAPKRGVLGYLHRYLTPDGVELVKDVKFIDELEKRFGGSFKELKLKITEEGLQKPRSRKLSNELLVDINKFAKEFTGRDINFFENDPAKIAHHYYRHLKRAQLKTDLLQSLMKHFMREKATSKTRAVGLLKLSKGDISLAKIIKPFAKKPARITRFGNATWKRNASVKDIEKALKAAGFGNMAVPLWDYKQFSKIFDAVLGKPEEFSQVLNLYDQFVNIYRSMLTSYFPAFAVRNALSGVVMNSMAGVTNPKHYTAAFKLVKNQLKQNRELVARMQNPSVIERMIIPPGKKSLTLAHWGRNYLDAAQTLYPGYYGYLRQAYDSGNMVQFLIGVATFENLSPFIKASFRHNHELPLIEGVPFQQIIEGIPLGGNTGGSAKLSFESAAVANETLTMSQFLGGSKHKGHIKIDPTSAPQQTIPHELAHNAWRIFLPNEIKEEMLDNLFRNFSVDALEAVVGKNLVYGYIGEDAFGQFVDNISLLRKHGVLEPEQQIEYTAEFIDNLYKDAVGYPNETANAILAVTDYMEKIRRTIGEEFMANLTGATHLQRSLNKLAKDNPTLKLVADEFNQIIRNQKSITDNWVKFVKYVRKHEGGKPFAMGKMTRELLEKLTDYKGPAHYLDDETAWHYTTMSREIKKEGRSLYDQLYADGVISGGQTQEIRDLLESTLSTRTGKIARGYKNAAENPIKFLTGGRVAPTFAPLGYEGNQNIENVIRVAHYLSKRAEGLSHIESVASVKKYLFDYSDLTKFEKKYMRRSMLFYTWTRKNIPLMLGALVEHPRYMANYLRATGHMNPNAQQSRPKWLPDSLHIGRKNGIELAVALGLPMEDLSRYDPEGQGIGRSLQKLLGETVPPIKIGAQLASGKNFFTGRNLEGGLGERVLSESPLSRAGTTLSRILEPATGMTRASTIASLLTGVSARKVDEKRSAMQNALTDLEVRLNKMWRAGKVRKVDDYTYRTVNGERIDEDLVKMLLSTQGKIRSELRKEPAGR